MTLERGIMGVSLANLFFVAVVAIIAIIAYNKWVAQKTVLGVTLPQA